MTYRPDRPVDRQAWYTRLRLQAGDSGVVDQNFVDCGSGGLDGQACGCAGAGGQVDSVHTITEQMRLGIPGVAYWEAGGKAHVDQGPSLVW